MSIVSFKSKMHAMKAQYTSIKKEVCQTDHLGFAQFFSLSHHTPKQNYSPPLQYNYYVGGKIVFLNMSKMGGYNGKDPYLLTKSKNNLVLNITIQFISSLGNKLTSIMGPQTSVILEEKPIQQPRHGMTKTQIFFSKNQQLTAEMNFRMNQ